LKIDMAEENSYTRKDIGNYRPIVLAPEFLKAKDFGAVRISLETLLTNVGAEKKAIKPTVEALLPHPQALQAFIQNHAKVYKEALDSATLKDLRALYSGLFEEMYTKENLPLVNGLFNSDETYGDFMERYDAVKEKAESPTTNFNDKEKKEAEVYLEELNKIYDPLTAFEAMKINEVGAPFTKDSLKERLNAPYEKSREEEPKAA
jgi:hypothetical protein